MRRRATYLAVLVLALGVMPPAAPAGAGSGFSQSVTLAVQLAPLPPQTLAEVCLDEECEVVRLSGTSSADFELTLVYTLAEKAKLPNVDAAGPVPAACAVQNADGSTRRRMGAAIAASAARFTDQSTLQLAQGGTTIARKVPSRRPSRTDAVSARVCLL